MNSRLQSLLQDKRARRLVLLAALWVPAIIVLIVVREVLLPFVLALLIAYVIAPVVRRIAAVQVPWVRGERKNIPRWLAVIILYLGFAGLLWLAGAIFVPQLYREAVRLAKEGTVVLNQLDDASIARFAKRLEDFADRYNLPVHLVAPAQEEDPETVGDLPPPSNGELNIDVVEILKGMVRDAKVALAGETSRLLSQLQRVVAGVVGFVAKFFLVLMLTAFIAADSERIVSFFFTITPVRDRGQLSDLLARIDRGLSGVVRGQLTICVVNGILTLVGLLLLKVKFAFLLATIAAIFSLVPIFGSILSTIPIVIVALSSGPTTALLSLLWIVGIHALEANLLNPKIMGDAAKIHPALIVLALIIGEHYSGIVGALLAVPIMSILVTIFKAARARAMQLDEEIAQQEAHEPPPAPVVKRGPRIWREDAAG